MFGPLFSPPSPIVEDEESTPCTLGISSLGVADGGAPAGVVAGRPPLGSRTPPRGDSAGQPKRAGPPRWLTVAGGPWLHSPPLHSLPPPRVDAHRHLPRGSAARRGTRLPGSVDLPRVRSAAHSPRVREDPLHGIPGKSSCRAHLPGNNSKKAINILCRQIGSSPLSAGTIMTTTVYTGTFSSSE